MTAQSMHVKCLRSNKNLIYTYMLKASSSFADPWDELLDLFFNAVILSKLFMVICLEYTS